MSGTEGKASNGANWVTVDSVVGTLTEARRNREELEVVFLVGAGMSAAAGVPITRQITLQLLEKHYLEDAFDDAELGDWPSYEHVHSKLVDRLEKVGKPGHPVPSVRFRRWLADEYPQATLEHLPDYFDVIETAADRAIHSKALRGDPGYEVAREAKLAEFFQILSSHVRPDLGYYMLAQFLEKWWPCHKVLTTNFDSLIAQALTDRGRRSPYPRPWNKAAYYDTHLSADRDHIDVYYLHGERGTARIQRRSLDRDAIGNIRGAFHQIGTSSARSVLFVLGYAGADQTVLAGLTALGHPRVFSEGVWWHVRPGSSIPEKLARNIGPDILKRIQFVEYARCDLMMQELCARVFGEMLEPFVPSGHPYRLMTQVPPPPTLRYRLPEDIILFFSKRKDIDLLAGPPVGALPGRQCR